jgi:ferritin-like metal-binding protein YciE
MSALSGQVQNTDEFEEAQISALSGQAQSADEFEEAQMSALSGQAQSAGEFEDVQLLALSGQAQSTGEFVEAPMSALSGQAQSSNSFEETPMSTLSGQAQSADEFEVARMSALSGQAQSAGEFVEAPLSALSGQAQSSNSFEETPMSALSGQAQSADEFEEAQMSTLSGQVQSGDTFGDPQLPTDEFEESRLLTQGCREAIREWPLEELFEFVLHMCENLPTSAWRYREAAQILYRLRGAHVTLIRLVRRLTCLSHVELWTRVQHSLTLLCVLVYYGAVDARTLRRASWIDAVLTYISCPQVQKHVRFVTQRAGFRELPAHRREPLLAFFKQHGTWEYEWFSNAAHDKPTTEGG